MGFLQYNTGLLDDQSTLFEQKLLLAPLFVASPLNLMLVRLIFYKSANLLLVR